MQPNERTLAAKSRREGPDRGTCTSVRPNASESHRGSLDHEDKRADTPTGANSAASAGLIKKWGRVLDDEVAEKITTILLENESKRLGSIGSFQKFVFPIIRRAFPSIIASDIVSVQPMTSTISPVFWKKKPKKTPLQELAEGVWADDDETADCDG